MRIMKRSHVPLFSVGKGKKDECPANTSRKRRLSFVVAKAEAALEATSPTCAFKLNLTISCRRV